VSFCRAHSRVKRWKHWSFGSSHREMGSDLERLLSKGVENHRPLKKGKGHRVSMTVNPDGKRVIKLYLPKKGFSGVLHAFLPSKAFMEYCMTQRLFSLAFLSRGPWQP